MRLSHYLLMLSLCSTPVWAGEAPAPPGSSWSTTQRTFLIEGLFALNSGFAALSPRATGAVILLTAPLAIAEGGRASATEQWIGGGGYVAIGAFDAGYPRDFSRSRVFLQNFAAWNLLGGAMLLAGHHAGDGAAAKWAGHVSLTPLPGRGARFDCHWTF
jgi:hypothetical protein